jgi:general secretion pathway protein F
MTLYKYTAMSMDGRALEEEREAGDIAALISELRRRGLILVAHREVGAKKSFGLFEASVKPQAVTAFLTELALMLRSGLPLVEALDLAGRDGSGSLTTAISGLRGAVIDGASFVQAVQRQSQIFGPEIIAMARVAEQTGDLDGVLSAVAAQRERAHALSEKVGAALRYPAFLVVAACCVLLFFLLHVIPQFTGIFSEVRDDPGWLVKSVFGASNWLVQHEQSLLVGLAATLLGGWLTLRLPSVRGGLLNFTARLPFLRGLWQMRRAAVFMSNLAVLLGQGVPMTAALKVLESIMGGDGADALARLGDRVRQGGRLHEAIATVDLLPPVALRMLRIGEETGELAKVAAEAGALYSRKLEQRLEKITALVGPAAILAIAFLIGGMMVAIMSTIVSVNQMAL